MDFSKFRMPTHETHVLYKCDRCGEETWYVLRLPPDMLRHERMNTFGRRCGGHLGEIDSKRVERGAS